MLITLTILLSLFISNVTSTSSSSSTYSTTSSSGPPPTPAPYYACCGFDPISGLDYQCFDGQYNIPDACNFYNGVVQNGDCFEACPQYLPNLDLCVKNAPQYKQMAEEDLPLEGEICGLSWYDLLTNASVGDDIKTGLYQYISYRLNLASNNVTSFQIPDDVEYAASIIKTVLDFSCPLDEIVGPYWISLSTYSDSTKTLKEFNKGKSDPYYNRFTHIIYNYVKCV